MNQTNEQKGSLIKLFHYCRKYLPLILIALNRSFNRNGSNVIWTG